MRNWFCCIFINYICSNSFKLYLNNCVIRFSLNWEEISSFSNHYDWRKPILDSNMHNSLLKYYEGRSISPWLFERKHLFQQKMIYFSTQSPLYFIHFVHCFSYSLTPSKQKFFSRSSNWAIISSLDTNLYLPSNYSKFGYRKESLSSWKMQSFFSHIIVEVI